MSVTIPIRPRGRLQRRDVLRLSAGGLMLSLARCEPPAKGARDVSGMLPPLAFVMTEAADGRPVSEADFRGKVALLYFGYTFCPDVCPTTLVNLAALVDRLGALADQTRILFVTVDPQRDTLEVLKAYTAQFGPRVIGLRGTADQLAALARRFRVAYSVTPSADPSAYQVTHSASVYVFDRAGAARLLIPSLDTATPDIDGAVRSVRGLFDAPAPRPWLERLLALS